MKQVRRYTEEEVHYAVSENIEAFDIAMAIIIKSLSKLPARVVDKLAKGCLILVPAEHEKRGMHLPRQYLKGKEVIVLAEGIFELPMDETEYVILHEVAHFWLRHKSPVLESLGNDVYERQEHEADEMVEKWLKDFEGSIS